MGITNQKCEYLDSDSHKSNPKSTPKTILHITHWKVGGQWIHKLLIQLSLNRIVSPVLDQSQFLKGPIKLGFNCPTLYLKYSEFNGIIDNRFERLTRGGPRGEEYVHSHERKGIKVDWISYFTPSVKNEFKRQYGELLVLAGYEKDLNW